MGKYQGCIDNGSGSHSPVSRPMYPRLADNPMYPNLDDSGQPSDKVAQVHAILVHIKVGALIGHTNVATIIYNQRRPCLHQQCSQALV